MAEKKTVKFSIMTAESSEPNGDVFVPLLYEDENGRLIGVDALKQLVTLMAPFGIELDIIPMPEELWPTTKED